MMTELIAIAFVAIFIGLSLGLLGSGGAILTVPALTYIVGQDEKTAIASSLAIVGFIAFVGAMKYQQNRMINWSVVWKFALPSMLASYAAAGLSVYLSGTQQITLFAVIMVLAAFSMFRNSVSVNANELTYYSSIKLMLVGIMVGCVSGLVGVGGGFLIVPALIAFARMSMINAVATSLVVITLQSFTGFAKYYAMYIEQDLAFNWQVIIIVAVIGALSSLWGHKISNRVSQQKLKKTFAVFLLIMSIFIIIKSFGILF